MTSEISRKFTSLPAADSGPLRLDLLGGPMMSLSGPPVARASRSARPVKAVEPMIQGICGRTYIASPVPSGPLSSWENRLRQRLGMVGSTESALIWREKVTPAGASISRLAVSTRHTNGTGNTGSHWRTPIASNKGGGDTHTVPQIETMLERGQSIKLQDQMVQVVAHWPTMMASDARKQSENPEAGWRRMTKGQQIGLNTFMAMTANAYHPTPQARDGFPPHKAEYIAKHKANGHGMSNLNDLLHHSATAHTGQTPNGSSVTTTKRGAPNPVFAFWLMGFPAEWICGALEAMQSYRKPQKKSSPRS